MSVRYEHQTFILVIDYNCTIVNTKRLPVFQMHVCWHVCATSRLCVCSANDRFRKSNVCLFRSNASKLPASAFFFFFFLFWRTDLDTKHLPFFENCTTFVHRTSSMSVSRSASEAVSNTSRFLANAWKRMALAAVMRTKEAWANREFADFTKHSNGLDERSYAPHQSSQHHQHSEEPHQTFQWTATAFWWTSPNIPVDRNSILRNLTKHSSGPQQHSDEPHQTFQWTATALWWTSPASQ